ncbi:MAG: adenosylcobinamide-GDP ribazoletransferase [Desulfovibrionaceae bacterium]|nr:adenosylcobinamide-GDP ribazoletransferase [Desulfovibrionaceae bacterium]
MHLVQRIWDALSFLTCIPARRDQTAAACAESFLFFAPAGLLIGCLLLALSLPLPVCCLENEAGLAPLLFAWIWLVFECMLTRALHWDGLADVFDALGSGRTGDEFFAVLSDSRIGTFGVLGLLFVFSGQFLALQALFAKKEWLSLVLAPAWARAVPLVLAARFSFRQDSRLGLFFARVVNQHPGAIPVHATLLLLLPILQSFLLSPLFLLLIPLQYGLISLLVLCAKKQGGLSGDFLGASIELSQLLFLFLAFL